jgi:competence protein ComEA
MEQILTKLRHGGWRVILGGAGILLLGFGVWQIKQSSSSGQVEVITPLTTKETSGGVVVADVGGAVKKPGLYRFDAGIRLGEAVAAAGGMTELADQNWVARSLNQAEAVKDGQKIYIPIKNQGTEELKNNTNNTTQVSGAETVNVNSATAAELDALWGIGEVRAQAIVSNRPYSSIEELMVKAGVPKNVVEKNKDKLSIY